MIVRGKPYGDEEIAKVLHPLVREWFFRKFDSFTPPQRYAIIPALEGKNVLVTSPTGSGKTLAGFLPVISDLIRLAERGELEDRVYAVYVSPLRALNNDIRRNLEEPLREIYELARVRGIDLREIRIAVRTGDTPQDERQRQLRKPPHILITTPETLAIVLSSPKFSQYLTEVRYLIVDEIHAIAENKRGTHLTLSMERLENLQRGKMVRIGLSATIHPLEEVAKFLVGNGRGCIVADVTFAKPMDIKVISPIDDFFSTPSEKISQRLYSLLAELVKSSRTCLIFTNTRSATERVVYHLKKLLPEYPIKAHHSSLSREVRLEVEEELKSGKLKAVVCVSPDSKILTERGFIEIQKLRKERIVGIEDFRTKLVEFGWPLMVDVGRGYRIRTKLGFEIICTPEHKFLTIEEDGVIWKDAKDFKVGEFIGVVRRIQSWDVSIPKPYPELDGGRKPYGSGDIFGAVKTSNIFKGEYLISENKLFKKDDGAAIGGDEGWLGLKFTPFMARLLGFWLANGSLTLFFSSDHKLLEKYKAIVNEFGYGIEIRRKHLCRFDLPKVLFDIFRSVADGKETEFIYTLPEEHKIEFLSGYFDGNGHLKVKNGKLYSAGFVTYSRELAEVIRNVLLYFGIVASIRERKCESMVRGGVGYTITVLNGEYLRKFVKILRPWRDMNFEGPTSGCCNRDVIPNIGRRLERIRSELGLSTYRVRKELGYDPRRAELGEINVSRKNLINLLEYYLKFAKDGRVRKEIDELLSLARGDVFFDKIVEIEPVKIEKAYGIVESGTGNYIVNGFVSKNSSTSLELGIDIGYIDLVVLLGSPKSINRALQRIGRSGHKLHEVSVGRIVVVDQDDLVECTVLAKEARERRLDRIHIPRKPLDVLAQHIVGMAVEKKWRIDEAFKLIKRAYPYRDLTKKEFLDVLRFLSGKYSELEKERVYGKIWLDEEEGMFGKRTRLLRPIYYLNVGTIPDEVAISVITRDGRFIGKVEEEFAERLVRGDIFVLAGRTFRFLGSKGMSIVVEEVEGEKPTVPSWFSEQLPLSYDLALRIQKFRAKIEELLGGDVVGFLMKEYDLDERSAKAIERYFLEQMLFSRIPTHKRVVVEEFEENGFYYYVFHTLVGRRANEAISRVFAYRIGKEKRCNVQIAVTDNGFMLKLRKKLDKDEISSLFDPKEFRDHLMRSLDKTELLRRRFRHVAVRSLMILRNYLGREKSVWKQQMSADALLKLLKKHYPNFPVLRETYREIMEDCMDVENALDFLRKMPKVEIVKLPHPSPFAFNIYLAGAQDVVLMEDRMEVLKMLHEMVLRALESKSID